MEQEIYEVMTELANKLNVSVKDIFNALDEYSVLKINEYGALDIKQFKKLENLVNQS